MFSLFKSWSGDYIGQYNKLMLLPHLMWALGRNIMLSPVHIVFGNVRLGFGTPTYRDPISSIDLAHGMERMAGKE